jgi:hypothetical protein
VRRILTESGCTDIPIPSAFRQDSVRIHAQEKGALSISPGSDRVRVGRSWTESAGVGHSWPDALRGPCPYAHARFPAYERRDGNDERVAAYVRIFSRAQTIEMQCAALERAAAARARVKK